MKKLLIAAAAVVILPVVAQAASAVNPLCKMPLQAGNQSWGDYYGCWGRPAQTGVSAPAPMMHHHHHGHHHNHA